MSAQDFQQIESSQKQWHETLQHQEKMSLIIEQEEYNKFTMLKPKVSVDGNQWCVLYGDNLQDGIAGFGDSLYLAIIDFNKSFHKPILKNS